MAEDKARDRRESLDSGRERLPAARCLACLPFQRDRQAQAGNAVIRSQGPDADRMDFINGLL